MEAEWFYLEAGQQRRSGFPRRAPDPPADPAASRHPRVARRPGRLAGRREPPGAGGEARHSAIHGAPSTPAGPRGPRSAELRERRLPLLGHSHPPGAGVGFAVQPLVPLPPARADRPSPFKPSPRTRRRSTPSCCGAGPSASEAGSAAGSSRSPTWASWFLCLAAFLGLGAWGRRHRRNGPAKTRSLLIGLVMIGIAPVGILILLGLHGAPFARPRPARRDRPC